MKAVSGSEYSSKLIVRQVNNNFSDEFVEKVVDGLHQNNMLFKITIGLTIFGAIVLLAIKLLHRPAQKKKTAAKKANKDK